MTKHKLDKEVEDVLRHYGIKGMRWDVTRTPEQIVNAKKGLEGEDTNGGVVDDDDESFLENFTDTFQTKLGDIGKGIKKLGFNLLVSIFGKAENKTTSKVSEVKLSNANKVGKNTTISKDGKHKITGKAYSDPKEFQAVMDKYKKQGFKKHKKDKRSLAERGWTFKTEGTKIK